VSQKTSPFLFLWYLCQISSNFANFGQKHNPRNVKQTRVHDIIHISFYTFVLHFAKTSDASECTLWRRPLPVCLIVEPEYLNFFKRLVKPLTFQPLLENSRMNLLPPKTLNLYKFSIKMQTSVAPDCCTIWFGLHQHVIGEAIDHVAWTAAHLSENWWTRLQTLARIIRMLLDSYLTWQFDFYV